MTISGLATSWALSGVAAAQPVNVGCDQSARLDEVSSLARTLATAQDDALREGLAELDLKLGSIDVLTALTGPSAEATATHAAAIVALTNDYRGLVTAYRQNGPAAVRLRLANGDIEEGQRALKTFRLEQGCLTPSEAKAVQRENERLNPVASSGDPEAAKRSRRDRPEEDTPRTPSKDRTAEEARDRTSSAAYGGDGVGAALASKNVGSLIMILLALSLALGIKLASNMKSKGEQRQRRFPCSFQTMVRTGPKTTSMQVLDVSSGGVKLKPEVPLTLKDGVDILLNGQWHAGFVSWRNDHYSGVKFRRALSSNEIKGVLSATAR